jgi:hypothetical protein
MKAPLKWTKIDKLTIWELGSSTCLYILSLKADSVTISKSWWCLLAPQRHAVRVNHRVFILFSDILFIFFIVILYKKIDGNFSHSFSRIFNFCTNLSRFSSNSSWGGNYLYFPENLVDILIINSNFPDVNLKQVVSYLIVIIREPIFLWW